MAANNQSRALMIYLNQRVVLEELEDAERGKLTLALLDYLERGVLPSFSGALRMAFLILRQDVDRSVERWEEECARRSAAGKKSAALRAAKNFTAEVSCDNDCKEDQDPPEQSDDTKQPSTDLNGVEDCSTAATNTNTNSNTSQNTNPNTNQNANQNRNQNPRRNPIRNTACSPSGERERDFARFWQLYPRKVGKQAARKAFARVPVPIDRLLEALERQRGDPQWQRERGRYIPHPVTWLNQGRWEDEPPTPPPSDEAYRVESL